MRGFCITLAIILIILSANFVMMGYDKLTNYSNPSNSEFSRFFPYSSGKNAYVGGDAYNYIINAGQATAIYVLASGCFCSAMILFVLAHLIGAKKQLIEHKSKTMRMSGRKQGGDTKEDDF